ncbi:menaquinone biosynthesis decarboxylase [Helicobacter canadensis]|uniref:3-octaprenyl-4-hydroxybenzoate carboxylyase n=1 Tax=Helicobacter canadensis MIT 98-5491 TaxID=537970 RepID=C5ZX03_9HELI|nr:menaquinone biosynthesis decarboxylase [Helicobacter canadensis]EES89671.1 3-octaprenyl-4-hydroxybenzoate carboxylyase [Helicobacter canadensis MIT 98-5491]EFR48463.1 menaquinone biosynthesis decarboxylase, SCO4490 family [Helicobacter canadensis MIT 98-5491]STO99707.1 3-octaprenyl-4-hydroxybenzoate decarboxylase [Helicobacter canadensis]
MRQTLDLLKAHNEVRIISEPLDIHLEIPHLAYLEVKKPNSKALLFTNPIDKQRDINFEIPVLMNLFGSFSRVELLIGDTRQIANDLAFLLKLKPPKNFKEIMQTLPKLLSLRYLSPKVVKNRGLCQEVIKTGSEVDLQSLPILKTWSEDGGAFITMGQCYTQSLDGSVRNLGMYRLQVYDKNHLGLHWQIHKDSVGIFEEYKKANQKMPVSIAIGGNPLYTWCATAPLPYGIFELMLYGFIKKEKARLVKCVSNELCVPYDSDLVIEGFVDTNELRDEGRFGDHTGFYTPIEPYPVLEVSAITHKKNPIYLASVVGKPPLEDKYLGYPTERIFLPLLQTTTPSLIDYFMPENGVFHNLILAKIEARFPSAAKQSMHSFWGVGQMSFVKHAIFVGEDAPSLESKDIIPYILNRFSVKNCLFSEGVCDALDHASPNFAEGGKLGVDCTGEEIENPQLEILENEILLKQMKDIFPKAEILRQYFKETKNPITLLGVKKDSNESLQKYLKESLFQTLQKHIKILVLLDWEKNDLENLYMILWRVVNNIDSKRDIRIFGDIIIIDATDKNIADGYKREWPKETDCDVKILESLKQKGLLEDFDEEELKEFYRKFHIDKSYATR